MIDVKEIVRAAHVTGYLEAMAEVMKDFELGQEINEKLHKRSLAAYTSGKTPNDR